MGKIKLYVKLLMFFGMISFVKNMKEQEKIIPGDITEENYLQVLE